MDLIRQHGGEAIANNADIPAEQNEGVMQEAASSIMTGMQDKLQNEGPEGLQNLMEGAQSGDPNHPAVQQMSNQFAGNIMQKFGIDSGAAKALAVTLIPIILSKMMNHAQQAGTSGGTSGGFSIGNILSSIMGGGNSNNAAPTSQPQQQQGGGGLLGSLESMAGGGGLQNIINMFSK